MAGQFDTVYVLQSHQEPTMRLTIAALLASFAVGAATAAPIEDGNGQQRVSIGGVRMQVFTYRPRRCDINSVLIVLHGKYRNDPPAKKYRRHARPLAKRLCMLVVAPLFDRHRFPTALYQRGGIVDGKTVRPTSEWTGRLVVRIVDWVRREEGRQLDYYLIGHSAGGQFLSRFAAFIPNDARRIVIANPSTHVVPSVNIKAPYGFGGVYRGETAEREIRRYLAQPVTIFLGRADTRTDDDNLADTADALAQGKTRHARGITVFRTAQAIARDRGWTFNWRLVQVGGVGHSSQQMFSSDEAFRALRD
jgi:dienelactone hydrolase